MNLGMFAGNVGRSELSVTPSGQKVLNFSLAVRTGWGDRESTLWVACALWGERAEKLATYVDKGARLSVSGDITVRTWESNGKHGAELTCNVQRLTLQNGAKQSSTAANPAAISAATGAPEFEDEIPF